MQHTSHLLMIKPVKFDFNAETAVNNSFQVNAADTSKQQKALQEFENLVTVLRDHKIDVTVIEDTPDPHTPDSIFPNNWISFHDTGHIYLYPMFAPNRRLERKPQVINAIQAKFGISQTIDLSGHEAGQLFLEGTGSMVLEEFCEKENYSAVSFHSVDGASAPIYHTNVMMCVADSYVVICLDSIPNSFEQKLVTDSIQRSGKEIIPISIDQMNHFAGNMLQVHNTDGQTFLVMSSQAFHSLDAAQLARLEKYNPLLHADITTIETNGGGSARCMLAEIFLPEK
jgi:hypothetical protein